MATLPTSVIAGPFLPNSGESYEHFLAAKGWYRVHQGKVRDTYKHSDHPGQRLQVATDRLSMFDFVMPVEIPGKGEVLTMLTHFWLTHVLSEVPNHLLDFLSDLPTGRCALVRELEMQTYELILRNHVGGSVWPEYQQKGRVSGHLLPQGLTQWAKLPHPLFTPSSKAKEGHDENITADAYYEAMGEIGDQTVRILTSIMEVATDHAWAHGLVLVDTKFEGGSTNDGLPFILGDEVLTPDSSRYFTRDGWLEVLRGGKAEPMDKEVGRVWGRTVEHGFGTCGLDNLDPLNPAHVGFVQNKLTIPPEVVEEISARYHTLFRMVTGVELQDYIQRVSP